MMASRSGALDGILHIRTNMDLLIWIVMSVIIVKNYPIFYISTSKIYPVTKLIKYVPGMMASRYGALNGILHVGTNMDLLM